MLLGDYIRVFQTEDDLYKTFIKSKEKTESEESAFILKDYPVKFHYLMRDKKTMEVGQFFSKDFLDWLDEQTSNDRSEVYYNTDDLEPLMNLVNPSVLQYNGRCYFMTKNSYVDLDFSQDSEEYSPYQISQGFSKISGFDDVQKAKQMLEEHVSQNYDETYFKKSHNVEDKAIPIYDFSTKLESIDLVKPRSKAEAVSFIEKFGLESISSQILFDSSKFSFGSEDFDSLSVSRLIEILARQQHSLPASSYSLMFEELISSLDFTSFLRIFDKRGEISVALSGQTKRDASSLSRFMSSFSLASDNKFLDAPMNYYTLKVLKNPENEYDYEIESLDSKSVASPSFSFLYSAVFEALMLWKTEVEDRIKQWSIDNDAIAVASSFFTNAESREEIFGMLSSMYSGFSSESFKNEFEELAEDPVNVLSNFFIEEAYLAYIKEKFGVNIRSDSVIGTKSALFSFASDTYSAFASSFSNLAEKKLQYENSLDLKEALDELSSIFDSRMSNLLLSASNGENSSLSSLVADSTLMNAALSSVSVDSIAKELSEKNCFKFGLFKKIVEVVTRDNENYEDYMNAYADLWKHENSFSVSGLSYGARDYTHCAKSALNDLCIFYRYRTKFDKKFLTSIGKTLEEGGSSIADLESFRSSLSSDTKFTIMTRESLAETMELAFRGQINQTKLSENKLNAMFRDFGERDGSVSLKSEMTIDDLLESPESFGYFRPESSRRYEIKVFKLSENEYCVVKKDSWQDRYFSALELMKNIPFVERIKGEHYYTEIDKHRSNVFSIEVKNSGLAEINYFLDEVIKLVELAYKEKLDLSDSTSNDTFVFKDVPDIGDKFSFRLCRINSVTKRLVEDEDKKPNKISFSAALAGAGFKVKDSSLSGSLNGKSYSELKSMNLLFVKEDTDLALSEAKSRIRKTFEAAVRKSINRYAPVDTTLWKIIFVD